MFMILQLMTLSEIIDFDAIISDVTLLLIQTFYFVIWELLFAHTSLCFDLLN